MAKIDRLFVGDSFKNSAGSLIYVKKITDKGEKLVLTSTSWSSTFKYTHKEVVDYINHNRYKDYQTQCPKDFNILVKDESIRDLLAELNKACGYTFDRAPLIGKWYAIIEETKSLVLHYKADELQEIDSRKLKSIINTINLRKNERDNRYKTKEKGTKERYQEENNPCSEIIKDYHEKRVVTGSRGSRRERIRVQAQRREVQIASIEKQDRVQTAQQEERIFSKLANRRRHRFQPGD